MIHSAPETSQLTCVVAFVLCSVEKVGQKRGIGLICPPPSLCKDNAAMIAWAAIEYSLSDSTDKPGVGLDAEGGDDGPYGAVIQPKWPLGVDYRDWE